MSNLIIADSCDCSLRSWGDAANEKNWMVRLESAGKSRIDKNATPKKEQIHIQVLSAPPLSFCARTSPP